MISQVSRLTILVAAMFALAACGPKPVPTDFPTDLPPEADIGTVPAADSGEPAPLPPGLERLNSHDHLLKVLRKFRKNVVLVNFWASWSTASTDEFPYLAALQAKFADQGLVVITVSTDLESNAQAAADLLTQHRVTENAFLKSVDDDTAFYQSIKSDWAGDVPATFIYVDGQQTKALYGAQKLAQFESAVAEYFTPIDTATTTEPN